jgi:hypothetical protein
MFVVPLNTIIVMQDRDTNERKVSINRAKAVLVFDKPKSKQMRMSYKGVGISSL